LIVYVNGDSHSAGAEAVNRHAFAEDDSLYWNMGRCPHPDNLQASYGCELANYLDAILDCDAESASSNDRILRTTWSHLQGVQGLPVQKPDLIIIGWSTWEREEWLHNGTYYQVTAGGSDTVPSELADKYKQWVIDQDYVTRELKMVAWHNRIFDFHTKLNELNVKHLFFNTYTDFAPIGTGQITSHSMPVPPPKFDWDDCYIEPYNQDYTYYYWLKNQGFKTVRPDSYHYGADAHRAWAKFLYQKYIQQLLTQ